MWCDVVVEGTARTQPKLTIDAWAGEHLTGLAGRTKTVALDLLEPLDTLENTFGRGRI